MGLLGKLIGTVIEVATSPIAVAKDIIPGCGGYIDGNDSQTVEKSCEVIRRLNKVREELEDL